MKKRSSILISLFASLFLCSIVLLLANQSDMKPNGSLHDLPTRVGERPRTTNTNPHTQLNQQPKDDTEIKELMSWAFALDHIERQPSMISVPGAIAMCMEDGHTCMGCNAYMIRNEFAHFHPYPDYSMHLGLRREEAETVINKGWGEWHPLIQRGILPPNIIMLYAPRNAEELEVAKVVLEHSYTYAKRDSD